MVFHAGCVDPVSLSYEAAGGPRVLAVQIGGEAGASRTAVPFAPPSVTYTISVTRGGVSLGSLAGAAGSGPFSIPLNEVPAAGDIVAVESFDGGVQWAEGSYALPPGYTAGTSVSVTLSPFQAGTGDVGLSVSFPLGSGDDEITAAELSLYKSRADYEAGNAYSFKRCRKSSGDYGAGEDLTSSIPIEFTGIPWGNYVVQIEFFRFKYVRVSRLVQTVIVRNGLTTSSWDGGGSVLAWGADKFASSSANLGGISIGGTTVAGYDPAVYSYSVTKEWVSESPALSITKGEPGQKIEAKLNGTAVSNGSNLSLNQSGTNSLAITVTAPDGVTQQTYTVSYTYRHGTEWYVSSGGDDTTGNGTSALPYATVAKALTEISAAYAGGSGWPGDSTNPVAARINISGTITGNVGISDSALYAQYPPIILAGSDTATDKINANKSGRPLDITNAAVILGDGLTLTGGNAESASGGGVYVYGSFTMNGGNVSGNAASYGGGVYVSGNSSFTMNGGAVTGNNASYGGGVYVYASGSFTMSGGAVTGNTANEGGGVYVSGNSSFTMSGGAVTRNTASNGGGVYVNGGSFTMSGGSVDGNTANEGGGVSVANGGSFTMSGGSVGGNTASANGGGVYAYGAFYMQDGALISADNDVWLTSGKTITITGYLTAAPPVARITPSVYTSSTQILADNNFLAANYGKFAVTPKGDANWTIGSDGKLLSP